MIETRLGEFEEVILLLVGILGKDAYAFRIADEFESQTGRSVSIGAVHSTLTRLDEKGFLTSEMGASTAERGGRRKRIYTITAFGRKTLSTARDFKMNLWNQYPDFATDKLSFR
ncbi:MAG: PadR family transcriptional regulator [Chryseolinea sp.]